MIGGLAGIGILFTYLGAAWTIDTTSDSIFGSGYLYGFLILAVMAVIGIFLFPRTIGMAFTPMSFATPIAFLIALIRHGFGYSLFILAMGIGAWLVTFIVGILRPEAT